MGNLATPLSVQKLQTALHVKAKGEPGCRFHALYDKLYREDVLRHAYACCQINGGSAGADGERFEDIDAYGLDRWLGELAQQLREKTYQPQVVRRVYIPKPGGSGLRPLSIPTIRDRTVQTAARLVLEPIFEADLPDEQYGYRPRTTSARAIRAFPISGKPRTASPLPPSQHANTLRTTLRSLCTTARTTPVSSLRRYEPTACSCPAARFWPD